ncbi:rapamycin-insensitive companion of mTOR-like isoform X2 [Lineus longissimus]|uniref:rapamycin-insensitive companion of mTOR-like isoform X2 n=1 Tax=Lineus longissimus TaxID=88925 RepID=UPI00315D56CC
MEAAMYRGRSSLFRSRRVSVEETVPIDYNLAPSDNLRIILTDVVKRRGVSKARRLGHLNNFVKLCAKVGPDVNWGLSALEICCCLRASLVSDAKEVRAASLRALRHFLQTESTLDSMLDIHIDVLLARLMDTCLDNEIERLHVFKLVRKILLVAPGKCPTSLVYPMVAIGNYGAKERDNMLRFVLSSMCELALYNPILMAETGGIPMLMRNVLYFHQLPRINECLLQSILYLVNQPYTRYCVRNSVDLEQILAPFTDCHFKAKSDSSGSDDREKRFLASRLALITTLKSWAGMVKLCCPNSSSIQSLLGSLWLPDMEIRKGVMDIFFDLFYIPVPKWTTDFDEALLSIDCTSLHDSWQLIEGFVSREGKDILPHKSKTRMNLIENHLALLLLVFLSNGLPEALVEVITTSKEHIAIRGTILLGEMLHLANMIIPHECVHLSHCLPSLIAIAASFRIEAEVRSQASRAISWLDKLHSVKKRGPVPCSLYLDHIMEQSSNKQENSHRNMKFHKDKLTCYMQKDSADLIAQVIKDCQVLSTKDNFNWDWDLIGAILKWPDDNLKKLEDQNNIRFIRRIVFFFKPSNRLYSCIDQKTERAKTYTMVGCQMVDFLLECDETESDRILEEWLGDIAGCLAQIRTEKAPLDTLFSPSNLLNTLSQDYFLIIGRFTHSKRGESILERTGVLQYLLDLMTVTSHDIYIKLTVSSLNYSHNGHARIILNKALTAISENARLYTAKFMRVLLRADVPFVTHWGMELLVTQLYDQSKVVAMEALDVIDEACEDEVNLHTLIKLRPTVLHLGEKGALLLARFLSVASGYKFLMEANYIQPELERWRKSFNVRYVKIVEEQLNESMTTYEKSYVMLYSYQLESTKSVPGRGRKNVYVPVHLYGQLVQHKTGYKLLRKQEYLLEYFNCIRYQAIRTEEQILALKAALWAVGHIGSSQWGIALLEEENIVPEMIKLCEESGVFSIRGTAFYCLGLIASTRKGADLLHEFGWEAIRTNRHDHWPVIDDPEIQECDSRLHVSASFSSKSDIEKNAADAQSLASSESFSLPNSSPATSFLDYQKQQSRESVVEFETDSAFQPSSNAEDSDDQLSALQRDRGLSDPVVMGKISQSYKKSESYPGPQMQHSSGDMIPSHPRSASEPHTQEYVRLHEAAEEKMDGKHVSKSDAIKTRCASNIETESSVKTEMVLLKPKCNSFREVRSNSSESGTFKSRSNSCNTTSGVSSYDSDPNTNFPLTPIPSSGNVSCSNDNLSALHVVHHSEVNRKRVNLTRIPSMKRTFKSLTQLSPLKHLNDSPAMMPSSSQTDLQGYATLRTLRRQRTMSSEPESEFGLTDLFSEGAGTASKRGSLIFTVGGAPSIPSPDTERQPNVLFPNLKRQMSKVLKKKPKVVGPVDYTGLCLPVDVGLMFQVNEGEDRRSSSGVELDARSSSSGETKSRSCTGTTDDEIFDVSLLDHTDKNCLSCHKIRKPRMTAIVLEVDEVETDEAGPDSLSGQFNSLPGLGATDVIIPSPRLSDVKGETPGSIRSTASLDHCLSQDTPTGRSLLRKEVMRLIVNISSAVGVKSAETALLILKQKFPKAFLDLCLYSEVSNVLAHQTFRLTARRFIQELFLDMSFEELYEEPRQILGIIDDVITPDDGIGESES